jgi:LmbE family N-acetylglucosaminyl deacetylase
MPASVRDGLSRKLAEIGERSWWSPPDDATPEQIAEFEAYAAKMLVPDESITTWVDVSSVLDERWAAIREHRTQISEDNPFVRFGRDAWKEFWGREAFIRRESRVPAPDAETDVFAGLDGLSPGPTGWGKGAEQPAAVGAS